MNYRPLLNFTDLTEIWNYIIKRGQNPAFSKNAMKKSVNRIQNVIDLLDDHLLEFQEKISLMLILKIPIGFILH